MTALLDWISWVHDASPLDKVIVTGLFVWAIVGLILLLRAVQLRSRYRG